MKKLFLFSFIWTVSLTAYSQLQITNGFTASQLVQNLVGSGVNFSNATLTGAAVSNGVFTYTGADLGIAQGVILTSGDANLAIGPNNDGGVSLGNAGVGNQLLDDILSPIFSQDACVLEFDFQPTGTQISFNYRFGSEEYLEFVNGGYNDAFGFFISGPGYATPTNIAIIPSTNIPVTIDNVNTFVNSGYYWDNGDGFVTGGTDLQYDGFTTLLAAKAAVQPCSTYHIVLVIGDAGDDALDSGVFLEGGSFTSESYTANIDIVTPLGPNTVSECNPLVYLVFNRPDSTTALTIPYTISGDAQPNVDYLSLNGNATFPINVGTLRIPIAINADAITEPDEHIIFTIDLGVNNCSGIPNIKVLDLIIKDFTAPITTIPSVTICDSTTATLQVSNPNPATTYQWYTVAQGGTAVYTGTIFTTPILSSTNGLVQTYYVQPVLTGLTCSVPRVATQVNLTVVKAGFELNKHIVDLNSPVFRITSTANPIGAITNYDMGDGQNLQATNLEYKYDDAGLYTITQTIDFNGCIDAFTDTIRTVAIGFYLPNTFTPNGDGKNDIFVPESMGIIKYDMQIFDRWGNKIFYTDNLTIGWDGTKTNTKAEDAVYNYVVSTQDLYKRKQSYNGKITLIR